MFNIRENIFETNSSSLHTLTICKEFNKKYKLHNPLVINLKGRERYRFDILDTPYKKIAYYLSCFLNCVTLNKNDEKDNKNNNKTKFKNLSRHYSKILNKTIKFPLYKKKYFKDDYLNVNQFIVEKDKIEKLLNIKLKIKVNLDYFHSCIFIENDILDKIKQYDLKDFILNPNVVIFIDSDERLHYLKYYQKYNLPF